MIRRVLCSAVGGMLLFASPSATVWAHDGLISTSPADGARVGVVPAEVHMVFTAPPLGIGKRVEVTDAGGHVVSVEAPRLVDSTLTQPLAGELPAGAYHVRWRVTSSDGHPISGQYSFTASAAGALATASSAAPPAASSTPWPGVAAAVGGLVMLVLLVMLVARRTRAVAPTHRSR